MYTRVHAHTHIMILIKMNLTSRSCQRQWLRCKISGFHGGEDSSQVLLILHGITTQKNLTRIRVFTALLTKRWDNEELEVTEDFTEQQKMYHADGKWQQYEKKFHIDRNTLSLNMDMDQEQTAGSWGKVTEKNEWNNQERKIRPKAKSAIRSSEEILQESTLMGHGQDIQMDNGRIPRANFYMKIKKAYWDWWLHYTL